MKKRLFIGFKVSRKIINTISMLKSTIPDNNRSLNWSSGNNLHLTTLFLGTQEITNIEKISAITKKVLRRYNDFNIQIHGTGSFQKKDGNQILFLSLKQGKEQIIKINYELRTELDSYLSDNMVSKFIPHITIAKKKKIYFTNKIDVNNFMNSVYSPIEFSIIFFTLFESLIVDNKVYYKKIDTFNLT